MDDLALLIPLLLLLPPIAFALFSPRLRLAPQHLGWLLALWPAAAFVSLILLYSARGEALPWTLSLPWMPSLHLAFSLYFDGLSLLFALLVTGIGTLVTFTAATISPANPPLGAFRPISWPSW